MKFSTHSKSLLLAATLGSMLVLAGCGEKTLDYRNAEINNGKIYAGNANNPFSGKVTNVPYNQIFSGTDGLGKAQRAFLTVVKANDGINYQAVCDAYAHDGLRDGKVVCKQPNSNTTEIETSFKEGNLDGDFKLYDKDGSTVLNSVSFVNGQPNGKQEIYSPQTHKLVHVAHWSNGVPNGEEQGFDENTGNRILQANWSNGQYDGEYVEYAPDGKQVIHHVKFVQGKKDGAEELFYPDTGKPRQNGQYVNGLLTGTAKAWDPDGRLVYERDYEAGAMVPDSPALSNCIANMVNERSLKDAKDVMILREDVARATCKENPNLNAGGATQSAAAQVAPELAPVTATASSSAAQTN
ncbi:toxin-antitoxin system YwqK family antitoxin [Burkholderia thailandensis]|uniref:toxin-antitoxin system YwqK family antitoxin n=1 Tax=Burkholderia thailandensis TaxID=57975 RepID=UPI0022AC88A1|nr:toxin-antitoxin system YwqK family antitoxin [Burkholderia thailandensis]MCZ2903232.1 toxin-antitoxin system YwqK family antitoxin [Burkholderia thailandensis]MDD1484062.1 toxin-antitoxin system YwqK family antitoxin [Burkholderia thailandensis]MDD1489957.1 toxin-antitoxin system YwqK family antitoxin [Burkholderia thailandensis]MDD1496313.1 toxin-antitoxin system YwqK family antitoxin [Burkholderia thailandensis]